MADLMPTGPTDEQIRNHAAGRLSWKELQGQGFDYVDVLAGLHRLGLRPFKAPSEGLNAELRAAGRAALREALTQRA